MAPSLFNRPWKKKIYLSAIHRSNNVVNEMFPVSITSNGGYHREEKSLTFYIFLFVRSNHEQLCSKISLWTGRQGQSTPIHTPAHIGRSNIHKKYQKHSFSTRSPWWTDRPTDQPTDGQSLLKSCVSATKNHNAKSNDCKDLWLAPLRKTRPTPISRVRDLLNYIIP